MKNKVLNNKRLVRELQLQKELTQVYYKEVLKLRKGIRAIKLVNKRYAV